jgi:uncharacterized protein YutE (UPF0331/DUF86 family)
MKEIKFSEHVLLKIEILKRHGIIIKEDFIKNAIAYPDKIDHGYKDRFIVQKKLDPEHVLRIVYEEYTDYILVITLYPGRRKRYEKD